jgi:PAS domain S-box-containing protein
MAHSSGLIGVARDVTEYRSALDQLQRNEDRMIVALEAARCGLWDWHVPTGEVYYDANWMALLGFEHTELPHTFATWEELCHPDDHAKGLERVRAWLEGRIDEYVLEHRLRTKTGAWKWILGTGRITERDENGEPLRVVGVNVDIDDRKRWEVEIAKARDAAEAANRAKSQFLANMSHEIRTPMNSILGFADLALAEDCDDRARRDYVATIRRNASHLLAIVNDILDISKLEANEALLQFSSADPARIIADVLELVRPLATAKRIELRCSGTDDLPARSRVDAMRLRQILSNLVGNAVKFTDEGPRRGHRSRSASTERRADADADGRRHPRHRHLGMSGAQINGLFRPFRTGRRLDHAPLRRHRPRPRRSVEAPTPEMLGGDDRGPRARWNAAATFTVLRGRSARRSARRATRRHRCSGRLSVQEPPTTSERTAT